MSDSKCKTWPDVKATLDGWKANPPDPDSDDTEYHPSDNAFEAMYLFVRLCIEKPSRYFDIPVPARVNTTTCYDACFSWRFREGYFWESLTIEFNSYGDLHVCGYPKDYCNHDNYWFYLLDTDEEPGVNQETIERMLASMPMSFAECKVEDGLAAQDPEG